MNLNHCKKYAELLIQYCCEVAPGDRVLIRSSYLAEPLILECQKQILQAGGLCECDISLPTFAKQKYQYSSIEQLNSAPILYEASIKTFDVIISICAPFDCFELNGINEENRAASIRFKANQTKNDDSKQPKSIKMGDLQLSNRKFSENSQYVSIRI